MTTPLPVTVLAGFLGAGKTSLLTHLLNNRAGLRVAVIVNDMSQINIDAGLVQDATALSRVDERLVELTNGCICCTLRDDLLAEVARLAREDRFDYLLIEASGMSEPLPIAATFTLPDAAGRILGEIARLDTCVTVVDAAHWLPMVLADLDEDEDDAEDTASDDDAPSLASLLIEQVEFADVIVINKTDLVSAEQLGQVEALLRRLNGEARLVRTRYGRVPPDAVLNTRAFSFDRLTLIPTWTDADHHEHREAHEHGNGHAHEHGHDHGDGHDHIAEYGVSSFVFRARRPFHPARLAEIVQSPLMDPVLRSKGTIWLASRPEDTILWSQAGRELVFDLVGTWWADTPQAEWPADPAERALIDAVWQAPTGDRRQELVVIGLHMPHAPLIAAFEAALLTDDELAQGPAAWRAYDDPFPAWEETDDEDPGDGAAGSGGLLLTRDLLNRLDTHD